jgi:hypothetical protein
MPAAPAKVTTRITQREVGDEQDPDGSAQSREKWIEPVQHVASEESEPHKARHGHWQLQP